MLVLVAFSMLVLGADPAPPDPERAASALDVASALETALGDAIARAEPSVVAIARIKNEASTATTAVRGHNAELRIENEPTFPRLDRGDDFLSTDSGAGVVIGPHGEILTAFHVVKGARQLIVRAVNRQQFEAEVIAADSRSDLAVIVPRESPGIAPPRLKPIVIGDASKLRKGSFLVALGNPFNVARDGKASASWGILANIARRVIPDPEDEKTKTSHDLRFYPTLLQLDSKLNLGMSGGAVINLKGELVGLTTTAASTPAFDVHAGYAMPMDAVYRRAVETLRQGKEVEYGLLGVNLHTDDPTNRIKSAAKGTPAAECGLDVGDAIAAVNGTPTDDAEAVQLAINTLSAGSVVRLKIVRDGKTMEKVVELAKLPVPGPVIVTNRPRPWRGIRVDYMNPLLGVQGVDEQAGERDGGGVQVTEVEPDSPASKAGLSRQTVIWQVGDQKVRSPRDFAKAVAGRDGPVPLKTNSGSVVVE